MDIIEMKYNADYSVIQANELIRSNQDEFSLLETKLIRLTISQILQSDDDLNTYTCNISDLSRFLNVSKSDICREAKSMADSILRKVIMIRTGTDKHGNANFKAFQWVSFFEYQDGIITIKLHERLKPYLIALDKLFTQYQYNQILTLPSANSIRLYELLISFANMKYHNSGNTKANNGEFEFSLSYLRDFFNCTDKYSNAGDFIKRVISPSVDAINARTVLPVEYKTVKTGRSITSVVFTLGNWNADNTANLMERLRSDNKYEQLSFSL